jgi:hypothetical protein
MRGVQQSSVCRRRCSSTLLDPLGWPNATIASGDAGDIVIRLKEESEVPLRPQASLSLRGPDGRRAGRPCAGGDLSRHHRADRDQPDPRGAGDFDLELLESRTLDGRSHELVHRPTRR